jgi:hypothetical protein
MPLGLGFTGAGPGSDRAKIRYGFRLRTLPERQILRIFVVSAHNLIQYHFPKPWCREVTEDRREFKRRPVGQ